MRAFLAICSLAAIAYGKPQYNYGNMGAASFLTAPGISQVQNRPQQTTIGAGFQSGGSFQSVGGFPSQQGSGSFQSVGGSSGFQSVGFPSQQSSGGFQSVGGGSGFQTRQDSSSSAGFGAPLVHKQFFTISAPEDHDALEQSKRLIIGRPQRNYRVVFIKAPSSSNANVKLQAEYAPQEEKTAIYVLTKKDSALEVGDIATPAPVVPSKPEVFFIKYKTEDEAQHAQRQIQAEYDKIEGTSEHTDGGVAQVQSVVGSLGGGGESASATSSSGSFSSRGGFESSSSGGYQVGSGSSNAVKSPTYLPPSTH